MPRFKSAAVKKVKGRMSKLGVGTLGLTGSEKSRKIKKRGRQSTRVQASTIKGLRKQKAIGRGGKLGRSAAAKRLQSTGRANLVGALNRQMR